MKSFYAETKGEDQIDRFDIVTDVELSIRNTEEKSIDVFLPEEQSRRLNWSRYERSVGKENSVRRSVCLFFSGYFTTEGAS